MFVSTIKCKVHIGTHFLIFLIHNGLKQGETLSQLLFNSALQHAVRRIQENQVELKLNRTHQLLAYENDMNLLRGNTETIKENTQTLINASKEVGLEVNREN
jgi:hypothetical protein